MGQNFQKTSAFCAFSLDFQSENSFELMKQNENSVFLHCLIPSPIYDLEKLIITIKSDDFLSLNVMWRFFLRVLIWGCYTIL